MVRLELLSETGGLDGREAVMCIVEEVEVGAEFFAQAFEQAGDEIEVELGAPGVFGWRGFFCWLVKKFAAAATVRAFEAREAALPPSGVLATLCQGLQRPPRG